VQSAEVKNLRKERVDVDAFVNMVIEDSVMAVYMRLDAVRKKLPTLSNINSESVMRVINDIWPNTNERKIY